MDHQMWTMAHRAVSHPAWTTLAGGATGGAGMGHTAGRVAASLGHDALHHRVGAIVVAAVVLGIGALRTRRRRGGARIRAAVPAPSRWSGGETFTAVVLAGLAGAIVWLVAGAMQTPKPATVHVSVPQPKVTHTTIVQHVTYAAAATHIPDGLWWVAGISVVAVVVIYLNRNRWSSHG
jgi:hypothetical protein